MSRINEDLRNIYERHRNNPINMNNKQPQNRNAGARTNVTNRQTNTVSQPLNNRQNTKRTER